MYGGYMLKKNNWYLLVFLLLLVGCLEPDVSDSVKSQNKDAQAEQKQDEQRNDDNHESGQNQDGDNQNNDNQDEENDEPKSKNLGSIFFLGNSHTFNTTNLEAMIKENGYEAKIYHINTGGNIPLGNDWYGNNNESAIDSLLYTLYGAEIDYFDNPEKYKECYRRNIFSRSHLSNLLTNDKEQAFRNGKKEKEITDFSAVQQYDDFRFHRCIVLAINQIIKQLYCDRTTYHQYKRYTSQPCSYKWNSEN
jgi:hypothetical protein